MKGSYMNKPSIVMDEQFEIKFRPRETETISLEIPTDTLRSLKQVAARRDMSLLGLLKFYIGQGLRHDIVQIPDMDKDQKTQPA